MACGKFIRNSFHIKMIKAVIRLGYPQQFPKDGYPRELGEDHHI